jgi:hypothetical protein
LPDAIFCFGEPHEDKNQYDHGKRQHSVHPYGDGVKEREHRGRIEVIGNQRKNENVMLF